MSRRSAANALFPPELEEREGGEGLPPRRVQVIRCACGASTSLTAWPSVLPDAAVLQKFHRRGWRVSASGRHLCPECRRKRRLNPPADARPDMAKPAPATSSPATSPAATPTAKAQPTPAASEAIVNLYLVMSDAYDRARKGYKPGWDDERVARETGLSVVVVASRRERDFGPLGMADNREEVRAALDALNRAGREIACKAEELGKLVAAETVARLELVRLLEAR